MIGSAHDGEVLAAAKMAQRILGGEGLTWEEFVNGAAPTNQGDSRSYLKGYDAGYHEGFAKGRASAGGPHKHVSWTAFCKHLMLNHEDDLSDWEQGFVESFIERGWSSPTPKQREVFERIARKCHVVLPD